MTCSAAGLSITRWGNFQNSYFVLFGSDFFGYCYIFGQTYYIGGSQGVSDFIRDSDSSGAGASLIFAKSTLLDSYGPLQLRSTET